MPHGDTPLGDTDAVQRRAAFDVDTLRLAFYVAYLLPPWPEERAKAERERTKETKKKAAKGASDDAD